MDPSATMSSRCRFETDRDFVVTNIIGNYLKRCHVGQWFLFFFFPSGGLERLNPAFNEKKNKRVRNVTCVLPGEKMSTFRQLALVPVRLLSVHGTRGCNKGHPVRKRTIASLGAFRHPYASRSRACGEMHSDSWTEILRERERVVCVARCVSSFWLRNEPVRRRIRA